MRTFYRILITSLALLCCTSMMAQETSTYSHERQGRIQLDVRFSGDNILADKIHTDVDLSAPIVYNVVCGVGYRFNEHNYLGIHTGLSELFEIKPEKTNLYRSMPIYADYTYYIRLNVYKNEHTFYYGCKAGTMLNIHKLRKGYIQPQLYLKAKVGLNLHITKFMSFDAEVDFGAVGFGASAGLVFDI